MSKSAFILFSPVLVYIVLVISTLFFATDMNALSSLLNVLVAIGGLLVAILTTIMNYWARLDAQRQTLYEKQLEAYNEIYPIALSASGEMLQIAGNIVLENKIEDAQDLGEQYHDVTRKHWLVFPNKVRDVVIDFESDLSAFNRELASESPNKSKLRDIVTKNTEHLGLLIDAFRTSLGIEKLHENTRLLIGEKAEQKSKNRHAA